MVEIRPGAVTHLSLIGMQLGLSPGPGPALVVVSMRCGLTINGRLIEITPDFSGVPETPELRDALDALASAAEKALAQVAGISTTGEARSPHRSPGLGRG